MTTKPQVAITPATVDNASRLLRILGQRDSLIRQYGHNAAGVLVQTSEALALGRTLAGQVLLAASDAERPGPMQPEADPEPEPTEPAPGWVKLVAMVACILGGGAALAFALGGYVAVGG